MAVYGREVAANMVRVGSQRRRDGDGETADALGEADDDGPLDGVGGLVSHPETNRASREYVNVFVNGRWVTANAVREAVVGAYGRQLAGDRYPFAVVDLDVDPATVDVNVHPRKLEVRFADEAGMRRQVRDAVESALLAEGLIRTSAPRGRSKADQTEISPERAPSEANASAENPPDENASAPDAAAEAESRASTGAEDRRGRHDSTDRDGARSSPTGVRSTGNGGRSASDTPESETTASSDTGSERRDDRRFRDTPTQTTFDGSDPADHEFATLPSMRVLGQLHDTYVVAETDDGLVLVDQHAADERVNFERLRERFAGGVTTQTLADPVELSLTAKEAALAEPASAALSRLGFATDLVDDRTLRVSSVPALLADAAGPDLVRDLIDDFADGDPDRTVERAADDLLGDLACYPSITGNTSLTEGSVTELLSALDDCENPYACPHGRPVVIEVGREEIEDRFERDYPGHGG